jgi:hypothetical protein
LLDSSLKRWSAARRSATQSVERSETGGAEGAAARRSAAPGHADRVQNARGVLSASTPGRRVQSVIGVCPGCAATRFSQARMAG